MKLSACKCGGEAEDRNFCFDEWRISCTRPRCPASTAWYPTQAEAAAAWERMQETGGEADAAGLADSLNDISYKDFMPYAYRGILRASAKALSSRPADGVQDQAKELLAGEWPGGFTISKDQTLEQMVESIREGVRKALSATSAGKGE